MDNSELPDTDLVHVVRNALTSVKDGNTDHYDQLKGMIDLEENPDFESVLQLETLLKILSGSVACMDLFHHRELLSSIFAKSLWKWDHYPNLKDALVDLIVSMAAISGQYLNLCLDMLVKNFIPQSKDSQKPRVLKEEVFSRVHAALQKISYLVPLAPSRLVTILEQRMPTIYIKNDSIVSYVDNLLKLESSPIGKVVGSRVVGMVMERMLNLDLEIGLDDILQDDSSRGMFDMELEDACEGTLNEGDEFPVESLNQNALDGNVVATELLDILMVLYFKHLESCQNAGRLDEVFENLFVSFEKFILKAYKPKFSQFLMFYACSLDPENCGEKFASKLLAIYLSTNDPVIITRMNAVNYLAGYLSRGKFLSDSFVASMLKRLVDECANYCRTCNDDVKSEAHRVFYSGCQAILYVLCFRMRSILNVPGFQSQLTPLESILSHKLNPLMSCNRSVVSEFLNQAKAIGLLIVSEDFIFDDPLESELRLDTFFPFNPCLLKISNSFISPNFIFYYDEDDDEELCDEVIVNGDADIEENCDDDDNDIDNEMNKMSITPRHFFMHQTERLLKMPSRIRPSTSPPESFCI